MFSDEELKAFKERIAYHASLSSWTDGPFEVKELICLLQRLEAAENVLCKAGIFWPIEIDDDFKAWRKAAGK